jgi:tungstate transport system substrate-binding protein
MAARSLTITLIFSLVILPIMGAFSAERLKLSSTTSTDNTGLLSYLLPVFEDRTGIHVDVIAALSGKSVRGSRTWCQPQTGYGQLLYHRRTEE